MGSPFRIPYGLALGYENQFTHHTGYLTAGTAGLFKQAATTADVTIGTLFFTNNSGATTITALTCNTYSVNTGNQEGRVIRIMMLDALTQFSQTGNIVLIGTGNYGLHANGILDLMQVKGSWYEVNRHPDQTQDKTTALIGNSSGAISSVPANNSDYVLISSTAIITQLSAISGGYVGQTLSLAFTRATTNTYVITTGGNLILGSSSHFVVTTGGVVDFLKVSDTEWYFKIGGKIV
jgi:hypothetical protein